MPKKGGNVGYDPMYLCFYDHNFPYVVRHFNFENSFGFAHTRLIFNAAVVWGGQVVETIQRYIFAFVIQHVLHHAVVKFVPRTFQQTSRV